MMRIVIAIFLLSVTCNATFAQSKEQSKSISLSISTNGEKYVEGQPVQIQLVFKNVGKKSIRFVLADNHLDPPGFIHARLWDKQGTLLTQNNTLRDGWWTVHVMNSDNYVEKKEDRISLKPGEEYTRLIDLSRLLIGCPSLPKELSAGKYQVQFSLGYIVSNKIEINIEKQSEK